MNRLPIVLMLVAIGCDFGDTNLGTLNDTETGGGSGGPTTATTSGAPTGPVTSGSTTGPGSTTDPGDTSPSTSTTAPDTNDTDEDSSSTGGAESSSTGDESSGSTGDPKPFICELDDCWTECSRQFDALPPFEGDIPCYGASEGWAEPPCDMPGAMLCPQLDPFNMIPEDIVSAGTCFLDAIQGETPGLLSYTIGAKDVSTTTVYVNGDGTVLLDARFSEHCGNGGIMGTRFIMTRNLDVIDEAAQEFQDCLASDSPKVIRDCVMGVDWSGTFDPDSLPWLAGSCSAEAPSCSF